MAAPQKQLRVKWYFISLLSITAILFALVFFTGSGSMANRLTPRLGLDLQGGTSITLSTRMADGGAPDKEKLSQARDIIEQRVNATGVAEPEVRIEGDRNIVVNVAGEQNGDEFQRLVAPAELRFRQVITSQPDVDEAMLNPSPTPTPSGSASPAPSDSPSPAPSASVTPAASPTPAASAAASTSPTPSASQTPAPAVNPDQQKRKEELLTQAKSKLGDEIWQLGQDVVADPSKFQGQEKAIYEQLKPFGTLSGDEVDALPVEMQLGLPNITCAQLNARPAGAVAAVDQKVVACGKDTDPKTKQTIYTKYLLDVAKVVGTDVATANFAYETGWKVTLDFKGEGQAKWTELTKVAYNNGQNAAAQNGTDRVAIVLDNAVVSAPAIQGVITGQAQITGSFSREDVSTLSAQLRFGSLPLTFEQSQAETISPTLGSAQLKAGLLAAGIGMLLVVVYAFFYYRLLGTVIFLSLVMSAILVFLALVFLGRQIGFTLTLAGIAGFIVSLGVAADSFVIYFERLKDEIREGRSPRSAVPRAWVRARRTIISANAISILAAVVLYIFAIGTVQGFAFALGLATVLDLIVVFLFRHPIMAAFARTKAFLSPTVSGLGRVLQRDDQAAAPRTTTNPKEA